MQNHNKSVFILFYLLLMGIALPFTLGFFSFLHPLFDSFSHFRVHLLIMLLPLLFILMLLHEKLYALFYLFILIAGAYYLYFINQPFIQQANTKQSKIFTHMQFNMNFHNQKVDEFLKHIQKYPIDVITLQEVTPEHQEKLKSLMYNDYAIEVSRSYPYISREKGAYPYQKYCQFQSVGGVAILSKHPFNEEESVCIENQGLLWSQISINNKPLTIASVHLYWPYPYSQKSQVNLLLPVFEYMPKPLLISGDFNAVAWSHTLKKIADSSKTKVISGMRWSINLERQVPFIPHMKLSIDHTLISNELQVKNIEVKEGLGSDHLPIVAEIHY